MTAAKVYTGDVEYFPSVQRIAFEGPDSDNPFAFKAYEADRVVAGKSMAEWFRFSVCYWHTFTAGGQDPFGPATRTFPWDAPSDEMAAAHERQDAAFEFFTKLGVPFYCFHDRDIAPQGATVLESESRLEQMVTRAKALQQETGMRLLWGTANLFGDPRFMNGASTNPDFTAVAHAGAQVRAALDATIALGGENYVFWGGREGYASLINTQTHRELAHMARFLGMARDYGRANGFTGTFLVEPKPMEPMKHQYDFDAQTVIGFLRHHGLDGDFKVNVEANHATLAGHAFAHELQMCTDAGLLGSIDANRGDPQNGWDTDQFPADINDALHAMIVVMRAGGLGRGGFNFDAKVRRESVEMEDLFIGHILAMDNFARALVIADRIAADGRVDDFLRDRYATFDSGPGAAFERGELTLLALRDHAVDHAVAHTSGKQEWLENIINDLMFRG
ncbi:MAG: xylose isomerase [Pseudomonadota bacterium]